MTPRKAKFDPGWVANDRPTDPTPPKKTARTPTAAQRRTAALPQWRQKRVIEFIEVNLGQPLGLRDLASVAGLTRMHFAAQFKATTGLSPYQYLLRRRIAYAQAMLIEAEQPLTQIAFAVGFQTQSHFTSVFKRLVGQPPGAWRQQHQDNTKFTACARGQATLIGRMREPEPGDHVLCSNSSLWGPAAVMKK
jgi:AraC-like DNA-binding protein